MLMMVVVVVSISRGGVCSSGPCVVLRRYHRSPIIANSGLSYGVREYLL
jgi:hypothetical protein